MKTDGPMSTLSPHSLPLTNRAAVATRRIVHSGWHTLQLAQPKIQPPAEGGKGVVTAAVCSTRCAGVVVSELLPPTTGKRPLLLTLFWHMGWGEGSLQLYLMTLQCCSQCTSRGIWFCCLQSKFVYAEAGDLLQKNAQRRNQAGLAVDNPGVVHLLHVERDTAKLGEGERQGVIIECAEIAFQIVARQQILEEIASAGGRVHSLGFPFDS